MRQPFSGSIPQTLDGIAGAADPLQAFADACGMSFKMDYLWIGNELVGATELGGSGLDLANTGVDQGQADARLGDGNTCLLNTTSDKLEVISSALNVGTGSMAWFKIGANNGSPTSTYFGGKWGGAAGYVGGQTAADAMNFLVRTPSGTFTAAVAGPHGTSDAHVVLRLRNETLAINSTISGNGTGTIAESGASGRSADNAGNFAVGSTGALQATAHNWGLDAIKFGPDAELVTATHRSNLQTWLGF